MTIASLILLSVLVLPPMMLAGKEAMHILMSGTANNLSGILTGVDVKQNSHSSNRNNSKIYDGMITVEIPIYEPQVVAYEPVVPPGEEPEIEIVELPGKLSNG